MVVVYLEKRVIRERKGTLAQKVLRVLKVQRVIKVYRDLKDPKVKMVRGG